MTIGRLGAYRLLEELGRGGMGTVYRATDPSGRGVAIKRLDGAALAPNAVDRFLRETQTRIEHPNVVRTLGAGMDATGRPYVVLELLEGETLEGPIGRGMPEAELVEAIRQACHGLAAIHAAGLVHRDVKPANLFRCRDGTVKVLDLGIAAATDGSSGMTATGAVIGTPSYLAPEQARGEGGVDPRADVWALGVVLYEGLARVSPFRREGTLGTLLAVAVDAPTPLARISPRTPAALAAVVHRCLEKDRAKRYGSAEELAQALTRVESGVAEEATAPTLEVGALGERRSIGIVLADGVIDAGAFERAIAEAGGEHVPLLAGRAAGLFGAHVSHGDEIERTLAAARAARGASGVTAIAIGRAVLRGEGLSGEALREAEEASARAERGVVAGAATARAIASRCELVEIEPGLFSVGDTRTSAAPLSPLLGREAELASLRRARDGVLDEDRALVTWIIGPPGIGKTRLAEAVRGLAADVEIPLAHRRAEADPHASAHALSLWTSALGVAPIGRHSSGRMDAQAIADRVRAEVLGRARELLRKGPLVLVLEDLQWADPASLALVEEMPLLMGDEPLWLVLTARPELVEAHPELVSSSSGAAPIEPAPLRAADVIAMARARGRGEITAAAAQALADHAGGNPLFVEHLLDAADAALLASAEPARWPLPPTIEHAVQARIDLLPADEKECLKRLAVFPRAALAQELEDLGSRDAERLLGTLVRRELVARGRLRGGRAYRFRSPLVGGVAYGMLDALRRRELHRRAASVATANGRDPEEIGHHHEAAEDPAQAAPHYVRAALAAAHGGDARAVLRCAARAITCGLSAEQAFALHFARAEAARFVGDLALQEEALGAAAGAAVSVRERALAASERGEWLRRTRRWGDALRELERAVELARQSSDADTLARATCRQASTWVTLGRATEAARALATMAPIERELAPATRAIVEDLRGYVAGSAGDHGARKLAYARAAALYSEAGDLRRAAGAESNGADASNRLGAFEEAEVSLGRALDLARRVGNRLTEGYALANLGYARVATGRPLEALEATDEAERIARAIGDPHLALAARLYAYRARLGSLDPRELARSLDALATEAAGDATLEANARSLAARALSLAGEPAAACAQAERALAIRDGSGAVEEGELEIFLVAARSLEAAGRRDEATAVRARGRARLAELAARIVDARWRQSFLERIPEHREL